MYNQVSRLLMYGDLAENELLWELAQIFEKFETGNYDKVTLVREIHTQMKHLLEIATNYGFDDNLWHNYLTFYLMMNENPFSITCEKTGASDGSVNALVQGDLKIMKELFDYDFAPIEAALEIDCFTRISNYHAIQKPELMYNKNVSTKVRALSRQLESAADEQEFFACLTDFYRDYGVGMWGLNKAFRIEETDENHMQFVPINNMDAVTLDDLIGYELQN